MEKICVDLIGPYIILRKGMKENLNLKAVTMIDHVTWWFKITQYKDKREITIADLVETMWLSRYPRPMEITYDQGKEFIGHEFRKSLIEMEDGINSKPITSGNPTSNTILERIHQVLGNLVQTCNIINLCWRRCPIVGIFFCSSICNFLNKNRLKGYIPFQLVFGCDIILPIKHKSDW